MSKAELQKIYELAEKTFVGMEGRIDLETHHCGDEDFFEVAVWELKKALVDAYELGKASK